MEEFNAHVAAEKRFFSSTPWCAALLKDPATSTFLPSSRVPNPPRDGTASQDTFFRHTLATASSIPHCLGVYKTPTESPSDGLRFILPSATLLCDLQPGLSGFNGTVHGGLSATLFDEIMGALIFWNHMLYQREASRGRVPSNVLDVGKARVFTAGMNVSLRKPIPMPSIVAASATVDRIEGKKIYLDCRIRDGDGVEYAKCDGLWVMASGGKL